MVSWHLYIAVSMHHLRIKVSLHICQKKSNFAVKYNFKNLFWREIGGLYYKIFTIVIFDHNAIGEYYKIAILVKGNYDCS
jgi:hypothetical protein